MAVAQSQETGGSFGHDGNVTIYWADLHPADQGQPWCAAFAEWCEEHASVPRLPVSNPYYSPSRVTCAKVHGLWSESGHYAEGDEVFYDFERVGYATLVERIVSDDGTTMVTIGGNALPDGVTGDQAYGGGAFETVSPPVDMRRSHCG